MSSPAKKKKLASRRAAALDLGCSCRRTKLSYLFSFFVPPSTPKPDLPSPGKDQRRRPNPRFWANYPFSPSTAATAATSPFDTGRYPSSTSATSPSPYEEYRPASPLSDATSGTAKGELRETAAEGRDGGFLCPQGGGRVAAESVAVVKESQDPYVDFRDSMLQMIMETEIFAWEDLRELLHRFLALNSPRHHAAIIRAFSEVYDCVFAAAS